MRSGKNLAITEGLCNRLSLAMGLEYGCYGDIFGFAG